MGWGNCCGGGSGGDATATALGGGAAGTEPISSTERAVVWVAAAASGPGAGAGGGCRGAAGARGGGTGSEKGAEWTCTCTCVAWACGCGCGCGGRSEVRLRLLPEWWLLEWRLLLGAESREAEVWLAGGHCGGTCCRSTQSAWSRCRRGQRCGGSRQLRAGARSCRMKATPVELIRRRDEGADSWNRGRRLVSGRWHVGGPGQAAGGAVGGRFVGCQVLRKCSTCER